MTLRRLSLIPSDRHVYKKIVVDNSLANLTHAVMPKVGGYLSVNRKIGVAFYLIPERNIFLTMFSMLNRETWNLDT